MNVHEGAWVEGGRLVRSMPLDLSGYLTGGACQTRIAEEEARAALAIPAAWDYRMAGEAPAILVDNQPINTWPRGASVPEASGSRSE